MVHIDINHMVQPVHEWISRISYQLLIHLLHISFNKVYGFTTVSIY